MATGSRGRAEAGNPACHPITMNRGGDAGVDESGGGHRHAMMTIFKLRALRAPMYDARTGKKYRELRLVPGRIHTFGRSRSSCDVVFSDARVSRQHCQVYWDNTSDQLFLFEGAPGDILIKSGNVTTSLVLSAPRKVKPSLNGLYVDGNRVAHGGCRILNPGSEVSLIACTKEAQPVDDPAFGDAVGFFVDVVDFCPLNSLCQLYPSAEADIDRPRIDPKSDQSKTCCLPMSTYQRKRPLVNYNEGIRKPMSDKSSLSFDRRASYSSTARVKKRPKRSTAEIMGLLRQQQATSALTEVKKDQISDEGHTIIRGLERNSDKMELAEERFAKISSQSDSMRDEGMLMEESSRSRVIDGDAVTPLLKMSLSKPNTNGLSEAPNSEKATKPEGECFAIRIKNESSSAGHVTDLACPRCEVEEDPGTVDNLGRNLMGVEQGSISTADGGSLNGKYCGSRFLLNRLRDLEPDSQVPSQQTVSLQELLHPTDGLLGFFLPAIYPLSCLSLWLVMTMIAAGVQLKNHVLLHLLPLGPRSMSCEFKCILCQDIHPVGRYPVFPDSCCFATEKRQGIGCHHPKIFLLPRKNSIRVIVTSANLTRAQWLHVTNSVWWQDFPKKAVRDYETLFCTSGMDESGLIHKQTQSDFAVHLSSFVATLVADVPSAAHWALDLAEFDFSNAAASLVTSIPGLYGCPCPPVPGSVQDVVKQDLVMAENGVRRTRKFLAAVNSSVVGVSHRFKDSADPCGKRVRALAAILNDTNLQEGGMLTVQLERVTNLTADPNAVSVIVSSAATQGAMEMGIGKDSNGADLLHMTGDTLSSTPRNSVHIGFLPRTVAKWIAPLYDNGLCTFAACIQPSEVIGLANGVSKKVAQLVLYVFEGRTFSLLSARDLSLHHTVALCGLLRSMERPLGLWRLHQILSKFNWPDAAETNFIFGSSSIGTSLDAPFLAAFSVAAGKKAISSDISEESDSQWGLWTTEHEANAPSIGVVFPTLERVKAAKGGPFRHHGILCFAESTWERLKSACLLRDAIPFPAEREGIPMHVKVAQRRFRNHPSEAPYGWIYCGSHNFSPAAWGRPHAKAVHPCKCRKTALGCTLFISNYEVGLIFVEPPPNEGQRIRQFKPLTLKPNFDESEMESELDNNRLGLDKFVLPFSVPAPKYADTDQPATKKAIYGVVESWRSKHLLGDGVGSEDSDVEMASSEADEEGDESQLCLESEAKIQVEEEYGGILWSQIDPFMLP